MHPNFVERCCVQACCKLEDAETKRKCFLNALIQQKQQEVELIDAELEELQSHGAGMIAPKEETPGLLLNGYRNIILHSQMRPERIL